jgi:hypothetical protein
VPRRAYEATATVRYPDDYPGTMDLVYPTVFTNVFLSSGAFANLSRGRNSLAADFENDVTNLEAMLGGNATGVDSGDHHALIAGTPHFAAGRQREAELGIPDFFDTCALCRCGPHNVPEMTATESKCRRRFWLGIACSRTHQPILTHWPQPLRLGPDKCDALIPMKP